MGCGQSSQDVEAYKRNKELNQLLVNDEEAERRTVKLLLLGPGEGGKSTIFRQMKIMYGVISEEEIQGYRPIVHFNTVDAISTLAKQCHFLGLYEGCADRESLELVANLTEGQTLDERIGAEIAKVWACPAVQRTWDRRNEFQIVESHKYFLENIGRISQTEYVPSLEDILHVRVQSLGIVVDSYVINGHKFEMYDVGGQRNERRKWIHLFDNVSAVIYVASLSDFDQRLVEDSSTNRMVEAIELFGELCQNAYFHDSCIILFLNKRDLFEEKIQTKAIGELEEWSDFSGIETEFDSGVEYFLGKFIEAKGPVKKQIYHHVTCATDTDNVRVVFNSCQNTVLSWNMKNIMCD